MIRNNAGAGGPLAGFFWHCKSDDDALTPKTLRLPGKAGFAKENAFSVSSRQPHLTREDEDDVPAVATLVRLLSFLIQWLKRTN